MNFLIVVGIVVAIIVWFLYSKRGSDSIEIHSETRNTFSEETEHKRYDSLDEWKSDFKTLWCGNPIDIEFTYHSKSGKSRRSLTLKKVAKNSRNELYLIGLCHTRNEDRTFHMENIVTMILHKSKRYHHYDFLSEVIKIDASGYSFYC